MQGLKRTLSLNRILTIPWPVSSTVCRKYMYAIEHQLKSGKAVLAKWMRRCNVWKFDTKICLITYSIRVLCLHLSMG
jgi:hypothetical protein